MSACPEKSGYLYRNLGKNNPCSRSYYSYGKNLAILAEKFGTRSHGQFFIVLTDFGITKRSKMYTIKRIIQLCHTYSTDKLYYHNISILLLYFLHTFHVSKWRLKYRKIKKKLSIKLKIYNNISHVLELE